MLRLIKCYAECRYAECLNAECRYAECRNAECRYAECHKDECRSAKKQASLLKDCATRQFYYINLMSLRKIF